MHGLRLLSAYLQHNHLVRKSHFFITMFIIHHLDKVSCPLLALCGVIVTQLDSSVSIVYFIAGVLMFVFATCIN